MSTTVIDSMDSVSKEFDKSLSGQIGGGIGAEIGLRNNKPTIIKPSGKQSSSEGRN
ncbi:hypothetical protein KOY49_01395 [Candidatus Minimicrobia vallesae]|uniref:Uncharacterized protein n=1 Tax=Candidatus Minimicrobia vallesae TaxID=2841264 RepID=A0A8F1MB22_9BACT|nr:hypothetical protein [Candidatus Minimicrobia vallesae]QWQ31651.1 hypothetical protein KOY49_01395 [Candidatus Minimicrobia vallesae]